MKVEIEISGPVLTYLEEIMKAEKALKILQSTSNITTYDLEDQIVGLYHDTREEMSGCITNKEIMNLIKRYPLEFPDGVK